MSADSMLQQYTAYTRYYKPIYKLSFLSHLPSLFLLVVSSTCTFTWPATDHQSRGCQCALAGGSLHVVVLKVIPIPELELGNGTDQLMGRAGGVRRDTVLYSRNSNICVTGRRWRC